MTLTKLEKVNSNKKKKRKENACICFNSFCFQE